MKELTGTKLCRNCGYRQPLEFFNKSPKSKDGRNGVCSTCRSYYRDHKPAKRKGNFPFRPPSNPLCITVLQKIPRTPAGDAEFLKLVEDAADFERGLLAFLHKEAPHRSCYMELVRILLAVESAKMFRR